MYVQNAPPRSVNGLTPSDASGWLFLLGVGAAALLVGYWQGHRKGKLAERDRWYWGTKFAEAERQFREEEDGSEEEAERRLEKARASMSRRKK